MKRREEIEDFENVYVPADVKEDIKFGKIIPMQIALICLGILIISTFTGIFLKIFLGIKILSMLLIVFMPSITVFTVLQSDLPGYIVKIVTYVSTKKTVKTLADLGDVKAIENAFVRYNDGSIAVVIEFESGLPWDTATFEAKNERAVMYTFMIRSVIRPNIEIDLYSITAKEETSLLLKRIRTLDKCRTEQIRKKAEARIRHHAAIENKNARRTRYYIRLRIFDLYKGTEEKLKEASKKALKILTKGGAQASYIGGDTLEDFIENQLIPMAPIARGKAENIEKISPESEGELKANLFENVITFIEKVKNKFEHKKPDTEEKAPEHAAPPRRQIKILNRGHDDNNGGKKVRIFHKYGSREE